MNALKQYRSREVAQGKRILLYVEHNAPVDDGYLWKNGHPFYASGLRWSVAVFAPRHYQHPVTYYPWAKQPDLTTRRE